MELQKSKFKFGKVLDAGMREISADGDIIVPDVKPDILKILQISGNSHITSREILNGKINLNGRIDFTLLYLPDGDGENVVSISSSLDFSHSLAVENVSSECYAQLDADLKKIDFQLINSRKLRIKTISELSYETGLIDELEISTDTDGNHNPKIQTKKINIINTYEKKQLDFNIHEKTELAPGHCAISEILCTDTEVFDKEYKSISGRIVAKGTVSVHIMYNDTEAKLCFAEYQLPFTEIFEVENAGDDTICEIDYTVADISVKAAEDNDGDIRCFETELLMLANITATEEKEVEYISDMYCPGYETILDKTAKKIDALAVRASLQQTLRDIISVSPSSPKMQGIYNVPSKINITNTRVMNDKTLIEGNIGCFLVYTSDSKENPICSIKKEIPFSITHDTPSSREGMLCALKPEISHLGYNINTAGDAEIRVIISIDIKILETGAPVFIENAEILPLSKTQKKGIVLYFVQPGDSMWTIAKNYHVSEEDILKLNKLEDDIILTPGMKIVIPMSV